MKKNAGLTVLSVFCILLSGCATKMTVMAGLSDNIKEYYSIYPSVEIDVAAVTEEEADELKKGNTDSYFSVGNAMRESLTPYTFMFSAEQTAPQTMKYNVPQWNKWLDKEPKKIAVLANMPRKTDENAKGKDPRILILDMSSGFMHHKTLYVEAKPGSVIRIYKEPTDPEKVSEQKKKEEQIAKRKEAEAKKKEAERKEAEVKKKEAEAKQKEAEAERKEVEAKKKEAEARKKEAEAKKKEAEADQKEAEVRKKEAEAKRKEAEAKRKEAEEIKKKETEEKPKEDKYKQITSRKKGR